jgi:ABC-type transporter Mla subunit MlaD
MISLLALGRSDRAYLLSGLFVLAGLLLLVGWVAVKIFGQSFQSHDYYAFLTDVTGLRVGTPVVVAGYKIGMVKAIEHSHDAWLDDKAPAGRARTDCETLGQEVAPRGNEPSFRLRLAVDEAWQLTTDAQVRLESPSLLGQPIMVMKPGTGVPLCAGSAIRSESQPVAAPPDVALLAQHAGQVLSTMDEFLQQLRDEKLPQQAGHLLVEMQSTVAQLRGAAKGMNDFVGDPKLREAKAQSVRAVDRLNMFLEEARQLAREARAATTALGGAINDLRPPLGNAAANFDHGARLTVTRLPGILADLERSAQDLSGLVADLRSNPPAALRGRGEAKPAWDGDTRR